MISIAFHLFFFWGLWILTQPPEVQFLHCTLQPLAVAYFLGHQSMAWKKRASTFFFLSGWAVWSAADHSIILCCICMCCKYVQLSTSESRSCHKPRRGKGRTVECRVLGAVMNSRWWRVRKGETWEAMNPGLLEPAESRWGVFARAGQQRMFAGAGWQSRVFAGTGWNRGTATTGSDPWIQAC